MNRDDVIRMARETGVEWLMHNRFYKDHLQHFAALVAAAEREACAKLVEESSLPDAYSEPALLEIANDIRARGETSSMGQT